MFAILAHIRPLDRLSGQRVDVRVASAPGPEYQGLGGFVWESAISRRPRAAIELFAADLSAGTRTASADLELSLSAIREVDTTNLYWPGAPAILYRGDGLTWPGRVEFEGIVASSPPNSDDDKLVLNLRVSIDNIDKPLLVSEFDGGGDLGGEPEMRGTLKPAGFGRCLNVEPVMIDTVRNILMLDGYGNLIDVDWLGEGLSDFGPSVGDYDDIGALAAAIDSKAVPPGRWATCTSSGLVGLGAPPVGIITCHATFRFGMTGALIRRILRQHAAVPPARIVDESLDALDQALPYPVHYWTKDQISVKDLMEGLAAGCNASPLLTFQNKLVVVRPFGGRRIGDFIRYGFSEPAVRRWRSNDPLTPYWQVKARVARPVRVLDYDEVNYADDIVNRGVFDFEETYRQGNTVWTDDGAQWLYKNPVASSGHIPPNPEIEDDYWRRLKAPTNAQVADGLKDPDPILIGTPYKKGDLGTDQGATWIYTADIAWDDTLPPRLPAESNAFWSLFKDAQGVTLRANVKSITIQASYQNIPLDGQLPVGGRGVLTVGSVSVVDGITWSVATSGCDATIGPDGGFVITAARSNGYVELRALYRDKIYTDRVTVTLNAAAPPSGEVAPDPGGGGAGGGAVDLTAFPPVTSNIYPIAPAYTAFVTASAAGLRFNGSLIYSASAPNYKIAGTATLSLKLLYRLKDSGAGWSDAGPEITGTAANSGAYPDYESYDGYLDFSSLDVTGLTSGASYEFGVVLRRVGNSATQPYGAITGSGL